MISLLLAAWESFRQQCWKENKKTKPFSIHSTPWRITQVHFAQKILCERRTSNQIKKKKLITLQVTLDSLVVKILLQ